MRFSRVRVLLASIRFRVYQHPPTGLPAGRIVAIGVMLADSLLQVCRYPHIERLSFRMLEQVHGPHSGQYNGLKVKKWCSVWASPVSLAATQGIARVVFASSEHTLRAKTTQYCFLFLQVLRCFTSLGSPPLLTEKISARSR